MGTVPWIVAKEWEQGRRRRRAGRKAGQWCAARAPLAFLRLWFAWGVSAPLPCPRDGAETKSFCLWDPLEAQLGAFHHGAQLETRRCPKLGCVKAGPPRGLFGVPPVGSPPAGTALAPVGRAY